jgi:hypothetical protein
MLKRILSKRESAIFLALIGHLALYYHYRSSLCYVKKFLPGFATDFICGDCGTGGTVCDSDGRVDLSVGSIVGFSA